MREARRSLAAVLFALAMVLASCSHAPCFARSPHLRELHHKKAHGVITYTFDPPEPGLGEVDAGGWNGNLSLAIPGLAVTQGSTYGAFSPPNALGIPAMYLTGPTRSFEGVAVKDRIDTHPGLPLALSTMINADGTIQAIVLRMDVYDRNDDDTSGALIGSFICGKSTILPGWQSWLAGTVTPSQSAIRIIITVRDPLHAVNTSGRWLIDNFTVSIGEGEMAVMLSEFSVRAALSLAQSKLNAEIAFVKSEAALGYDLPAITGWRAYDAGIATPDVAEGELFEIGDTTFPSDKYDQSTWQGGRTRVLSKTPLRIAINHANRGDADNANASLVASRMAERSRLYQAALVRTFRNQPDCGYPVSVTVVPRASRVRVLQPSRSSKDQRRVGRVEFDFEVHLSESSTGETTASGASLPACVQETP